MSRSALMVSAAALLVVGTQAVRAPRGPHPSPLRSASKLSLQPSTHFAKRRTHVVLPTPRDQAYSYGVGSSAAQEWCEPSRRAGCDSGVIRPLSAALTLACLLVLLYRHNLVWASGWTTVPSCRPRPRRAPHPARCCRAPAARTAVRWTRRAPRPPPPRCCTPPPSTT